MYPSPFCNLSRRRWMGGGVQVGCGAGGTPTGRLMVPTAGGATDGAPAGHGNPPPASRALWETAQLGKRRRGTPRQIPGHFAPDPCPRADGGRRRVVIQLSASGLYVDLKRSLIVVHLGQSPFQLVGCRQHGLVLAGKYLLVVREQHHLHHRVVLVLAEQYAYDRVLVN